MGGAQSSFNSYYTDQKLAYLEPENAAKLKNHNIGRSSLRTNNGLPFLTYTIIYIVSIMAVLGVFSYITYKLDPGLEMYLAIGFISLGFIMTVLIAVYFYYYVMVLLRASDVIATDLTREIYAPETELSLKHTLTDMVSKSTGRTSQEDRKGIFKSLNEGISLTRQQPFIEKAAYIPLPREDQAQRVVSRNFDRPQDAGLAQLAAVQPAAVQPAVQPEQQQADLVSLSSAAASRPRSSSIGKEAIKARKTKASPKTRKTKART